MSRAAVLIPMVVITAPVAAAVCLRNQDRPFVNPVTPNGAGGILKVIIKTNINLAP